MANLNPIRAENLDRSASIMDAVSGKVPAPRVHYPPYIEEAVAGAALALEKGHPHALRLAHAAEAEAWLDPKSFEGGHFHRAVARVLGGYEPGSVVDMSPKGVMSHIVTDTVNSTLAARMEIAVIDESPVMVEGMTKAQILRVELARKDPGVLSDISHERQGNYENVSRHRRLALVDVFHDKENVSKEALVEIDRAAGHIAGMRSEAVARNNEINSRVANFREDGESLFRDVISEDARRETSHYISDLTRGAGKGPMNEIEAGVQAHIAARGSKNLGSLDGMYNYMLHDARVVTTIDAMLTSRAHPDAPLPSPVDMAMRIEGMAVMMREADDYAYGYTRATDNDPVKSKDMENLANGEVSSMSLEAMTDVFRSLHSSDRVPALITLRIHNAVEDMSSADRFVDIEKSVPSGRGPERAAMIAHTQGASR